MQYTELAANVEDIIENTFTDAQMAMLVRQAEQKIYNTVQIANLRKNVYGQFTANNQYLSAPTDFLSVYSLAVITGVTNGQINTGTYTYLLNKDVNFIREAYPQPNSTGTPKHYAIFGPRSDLETELSFIVGPTPDNTQTYYAELHYYYYPESIVQVLSPLVRCTPTGHTTVYRSRVVLDLERLLGLLCLVTLLPLSPFRTRACSTQLGIRYLVLLPVSAGQDQDLAFLL
jgi:hypothetical protein